MNKQQWQRIWEIARTQGVDRKAYNQWIARNTIPHKWRQSIIVASGQEEFTHKMFQRLDIRNAKA